MTGGTEAGNQIPRPFRALGHLLIRFTAAPCADQRRPFRTLLNEIEQNMDSIPPLRVFLPTRQQVGIEETN